MCEFSSSTVPYDSTRSESDLAQLLVRDALQQVAGRQDVVTIGDRRITEPGRLLAKLPIDPRLGRMLLAARQEA